MFEPELTRLKKKHLFRQMVPMDRIGGTHVLLGGRKLLVMCSNDYLGLASHPALTEAAVAAMRQHGFGAGASRLVSGSSSLHRELEARIARFKGTENALVFNSGYAANTGVLPAVAGEGDMILSDELNHASIVDGCRLSKAGVRIYRHCDPDHLEALLRSSSGYRRRVIVTDGVFSMDGDLAPLPELVSLARTYDALLMVDDAHGTGVMGRTGRGTAEHFGITQGIDLHMGTLSKALGSFGAYVAGSRAVIDYLVNGSRSLIFSTALPPAVCAASIAALDLVEAHPEIRESLWNNRQHFSDGLAGLGIPAGRSLTPIIPVMAGASQDALRISERLLDTGIYATAIRPPTVPEGGARIRMTVTAAHSRTDLDEALAAFSSLRGKGLL